MYNIELDRELFECWLEKAFPRYERDRFPLLAGHMRAGEYKWIEVELMWRAWQAKGASQ
jgi:hypothetical protein